MLAFVSLVACLPLHPARGTSPRLRVIAVATTLLPMLTSMTIQTFLDGREAVLRSHVHIQYGALLKTTCSYS